MAPILTSIVIDRGPDDVFAYATDPTTFPEWQQGLTRGRLEGVGVGARCVTTRRIGGSEREFVSEITEHDPPRRWADHGLDGPIRGIVSAVVEPVEPGRSKLTIELDFEGHGIGRLLVPLVVRRQARREMPDNMRALKRRLEGQGDS